EVAQAGRACALRIAALQCWASFAPERCGRAARRHGGGEFGGATDRHTGLDRGLSMGLACRRAVPPAAALPSRPRSQGLPARWTPRRLAAGRSSPWQDTWLPTGIAMGTGQLDSYGRSLARRG